MKLQLDISPKEARKAFSKLESRSDVARMLEVPVDKLNFHLYKLPDEKKYATFQIRKAGGGSRQITAPISPIKILQQKLNFILQHVYVPKYSVHGFVPERSIYTNAINHTGKRYVFNIDIEDFFPSINFGRVRGLFMAYPYNLPRQAATTIAQICCFDNYLPQGAPTSPTIANMICAKMDTRLKRLAQEYRCFYTRYADDITFSTYANSFPSAIAAEGERVNEIKVGHELASAINENGFTVNTSKVRLQSRFQRQEVTGLIVNKSVNVNRRYIRKIRAALYNLEVNGIDKVQRQMDEKSDTSNAPQIQKILRGQIEFVGMIRGKHDPIYLKFLQRLYKIAPEIVKMEEADLSSVLEVTEGKRWKECSSALLNAFPNQSSLERMVKFQLSCNLAEITTHNNLREMIFEVLKWAETHGRWEELIKGAIAENLGNLDLKKFVERHHPDLIL